MEIWVRSQDKQTFMEVKMVEYTDLHGYRVPEENKYDYGITTTTNNVYRVLGSYQSKERALEIMDEISDIMTDLADTDLKIIQYEMPEE